MHGQQKVLYGWWCSYSYNNCGAELYTQYGSYQATQSGVEHELADTAAWPHHRYVNLSSGDSHASMITAHLHWKGHAPTSKIPSV